MHFLHIDMSGGGGGGGGHEGGGEHGGHGQSDMTALNRIWRVIDRDQVRRRERDEVRERGK